MARNAYELMLFQFDAGMTIDSQAVLRERLIFVTELNVTICGSVHILYLLLTHLNKKIKK